MEFLVTAAPVLLWLFSLFYMAMLALLSKWFQKNPKNKPALLMAILTFGLFYDAFVLALGTLLPANGVLKALSLPRYILHGALIPLLLPICAYALSAKDKTMKAVWAATGLLSVAGFAAGARTILKENVFEGMARFIPDELTPSWATGLLTGLSVGPILVIIATGAVVWHKQKNPYLFFSGLFMFLFAGLAPKVKPRGLSFLSSMFGECFMLLFFALYLKKRAKQIA